FAEGPGAAYLVLKTTSIFIVAVQGCSVKRKRENPVTNGPVCVTMIKHCGRGPRERGRRGPKGEETGHEQAKKRDLSGAGSGGADELRRADDQSHSLERHGGEQRAQ